MGFQNAPDDDGNLINPALGVRDVPRPLTDRERDVLVALLSCRDFAGREALLEQVPKTSVVGYCGCGCATVELSVSEGQPAATTENPINSEGFMHPVGPDPHNYCGVMVFTRDGYLDSLEIYSGEKTFSEIPPVECFQFY